MSATNITRHVQIIGSLDLHVNISKSSQHQKSNGPHEFALGFGMNGRISNRRSEHAIGRARNEVLTFEEHKDAHDFTSSG
jgi:hypothetical protein